MAVRAYYREDLALAQLETALRLYLEGSDFASVITLAGAAEEIFGQQLAASGQENSLKSLIAAVAAIEQKLFGEARESTDIANRAAPASSKACPVEYNGNCTVYRA